MKKILFILFLISNCFPKYQNPEINFKIYKPMFDSIFNQYFKTYEQPWHICGQIEQESGWNPKAQLKTKRELGRGFGQITIAYDSAGRERMNVLKGNVARFKELKGWNEGNVFDPKFQLTSLMLTNRVNFNSFKFLKDFQSRADGTVTAYNSGAGTILSAYSRCMKLSTNKSECSFWINGSQKWVRLSNKSLGPKYANKSPLQINAKYPGLINDRKKKYIKYYQPTQKKT